MADFNARRSRAKRPCPLWVDAFQRDTQHLQADEVGAYMLILMAMWTRETCDFPDDDSRLARVSRVSTRLWKSRIGPTIREFLLPQNGVLISERLRKEATYVERQVTQQSIRAKPENSGKSLKTNDPPPATDIATDQPRRVPTQLPNNLQDGGGGSAREGDPPFREIILEAAGHPASGITANGRIVGGQADFAEFTKAMSDLGVTEDEAIAVVREVTASKQDGPPSNLKYFIKAMQRYAGARDAPPVKAISSSATNGGQNDRSATKSKRRMDAFIAGARGTHGSS